MTVFDNLPINYMQTQQLTKRLWENFATATLILPFFNATTQTTTTKTTTTTTTGNTGQKVLFLKPTFRFSFLFMKMRCTRQVLENIAPYARLNPRDSAQARLYNRTTVESLAPIMYQKGEVIRPTVLHLEQSSTSIGVSFSLGHSSSVQAWKSIVPHLMRLTVYDTPVTNDNDNGN